MYLSFHLAFSVWVQTQCPLFHRVGFHSFYCPCTNLFNLFSVCRFRTFEHTQKDINDLLELWDRSMLQIRRPPTPSEKSEEEQNKDHPPSGKKGKGKGQEDPYFYFDVKTWYMGKRWYGGDDIITIYGENFLHGENLVYWENLVYVEIRVPLVCLDNRSFSHPFYSKIDSVSHL